MTPKFGNRCFSQLGAEEGSVLFNLLHPVGSLQNPLLRLISEELQKLQTSRRSFNLLFGVLLCGPG